MESATFDIAIETWLDSQRTAALLMLVVVVLAFLDPCALLCDDLVLIAHNLVDRTPIHFEFLGYLRIRVVHFYLSATRAGD